MPATPSRFRSALLALAVSATLPLVPVPAGGAAGGAVAEVQHVRVPSHDGVELDGWLVLPAAEAERPVPTVLWSAPYFGQCDYYPFPTDSPPPRCSYATGDDPELWDNSTLSEAVPVNLLLEHGYAVAIFNVRGTGNSGGCFSWFGRAEQEDQAFLVEWLAERPWSNGRIGMMGLSYHGTTPWEAAIQNPPQLKTIVVAGMISDPYVFSHTPQGATFSTIGVFDNNFAVRTTHSPPIAGSPEHATVHHLPVRAERLCPDLAKFMTEDVKGTVTDTRDAAFWEERRLVDRFPDIRTSVLITHGFQDTYLSGHQMQEDPVWDLLPLAPKRMLEGQWGHQFPNFNTVNPDWVMTDWNDRLIAWLDFWLKARRDPKPKKAPGSGTVDYQDGTGAWHRSTSWPPKQARDEVMYLAGGELRTKPSEAAASFRSVPQYEKLAQRELLLCEDSLVTDLGLGEAGVRFLSEPAKKDVLVAGNPMAYLQVESDQPGGLMAVHLFDLAPDWRCSGGTFSGVRPIAAGVADLRFHDGTYAGRDFPVGSPTPVRIDITNLAEVIREGHRLAAVVSFGDPIDRNGQPRWGTITVHGTGGPDGSHLVLPVVSGSLGGKAPKLEYPPRPFLPV